MLTSGTGGLPPGSWTRERAVLAVVDGDGADELFAGEGACVLRPDPLADDPTTVITAQQLLRALVDTGAAQVMVLPNGYVAAEELVAGCTAAIGWGIDVVPLPTGSMVQGLAALAVHEPGRQAVDDGYTMARAAGSARHGAVRVATETALTWAGTCEPGNGLGIAGDEVLIVAPDVALAATGLIDLLLGSGGELVTVLVGAGHRRGCHRGGAARPRARPPSRHRAGDLPHRPPRRRAADRGRVAVVSLSDRLDYVVGAKAAGPLDEVFGIRTVDDLLRHYPRSYVEGTTVRGVDDDRPPEGEHVTLVDEITDAALLPIRNRPRDKLFRVTLGSGRGKVTATFFHPKKWITDQLTKGTRVMLSGEVGLLPRRNATHPSRLPGAGLRGRKEPRQPVAEDDRRRLAGGRAGKCCRRRSSVASIPIYPASAKVQSWDIFDCVRQVLEVLDPVAGPAARNALRQAQSDLRGRGTARHPLGRGRCRPAARP